MEDGLRTRRLPENANNPPEIHSVRQRPIPFLLFAIYFVSFAYFYPGAGDNEAARFDSIRSLLDQGHFYVDSFAHNSSDLIKVDGHYYSGKAPGTMILGLPVYWVFDRTLTAFDIPPDIEKHLVCYLTSLFTVGLCSAFTGILIFKLGLRLKISLMNSTIVALALILGTLLFPFSILFFGHAVVAFLVLFAFYQIVAYSQENESGIQIPKRLWYAGAALGFAIVVEFPAAIAAGIVFLYAAWKSGRNSRIRILHLFLAILAGMLPLFIHNQLSFGKPFFISYTAYAVDPNTPFEAHKHGILGIRLPFEPGFFRQFLKNLAEITYRPLRGIFFLNPVLLATIPGFFILFFRWKLNPFKKESLLALSLFVGYFAFNAGYGDSIVYWGGGASFGPRHLAVMLPILSIPLFALLSTPRGMLLFAPLSLVSVFMCTIATAVEPLAPYGPNNIFGLWYLPRFLNGRFSTGTSGVFSDTLLTADSVAFNWGKCIGLPGPFQLLPLLFFWLIISAALSRELKRTGTDNSGKIFWGTVVVCIALGLPPVLKWIVSSNVL